MTDFVPPPPRSELLWDAVDFDGTLAHGTWSIDNPNAVPGPPIWLNVTKLHRLVDAGRKIVIHNPLFSVFLPTGQAAATVAPDSC